MRSVVSREILAGPRSAYQPLVSKPFSVSPIACTLGSVDERLALHTPIARSRPLSMNGFAASSVFTWNWIWPAIRSVSAWPAPLYGMFTASILAMVLIISTARYAELPAAVPAVSCPGRALASAMNSLTLLTGNDGCTTSTVVVRPSWLIMVKSFTGSKGSFLYSVGLIACGVVAITMVWPSGAERATNSVPIMVAPPARFSMTICWPNCLVSSGLSRRARMSVPPPGAAGTTRRIGRDGKVCASATAPIDSKRAAANRRPACNFSFFMARFSPGNILFSWRLPCGVIPAVCPLRGSASPTCSSGC